MKKIAIITARSGSKGLPNKNVLFANGKPLMAYSIEAALESGEFEKVIVSTDSQEYIDLLSHYPIEFVKRSAELASDKASSFVVIEDVLNRYSHVDYDYFVLLQPTSPLRTTQHIQEANAKFEANFEKFDFLVSVSDAHKPTTLTRQIDEDESLKNFKLDYSNYARQQYHPEYSPNGAIFSAKPQAYLEQKHFYGEKCIAYFMSKEVSVDIDDRLDFEYFYFILQQRNKDKILLETIKKTISAKKDNFNQTKEISLIGHSILDYWNIEEINNQTVNNLAIAGITNKQYIDLIIYQGFIKSLVDKSILMFGINDIVYDGWTKEQVLVNIQLVIDKLKVINPNAVLYFLEITPIAFRIDRNNAVIRELNAFLKENLKSARWIALDSKFSDHYGKLNLDYTNDGLHLNEQGYQLLEDIIKSEL